MKIYRLGSSNNVRREWFAKRKKRKKIAKESRLRNR